MKAHPLQNIRRTSTLPANYAATSQAHVRVNQKNKHLTRMKRRQARFIAQGGQITTDDQGVQRWTINGQLHRDNGPAVVYANGDFEYFQWGKHHRDNKPAYKVSGKMQWMQDDRLHRTDGPAVLDYVKDCKEWLIQGTAVDGLAVVEQGHKKYFKDNQLHRGLDLPAVDGPDFQEWHVNGIRHRDGGQPAVVWIEQGEVIGEEYYVDGFLHRTGDKPAVWMQQDRREWWVHGQRQRDDDNPTQIINHDMFWHNPSGRLHRENGPAVVRSSGSLEYYQNGVRHRPDDLPALIDNNGTLHWYTNGIPGRAGGKPAVIAANDVQYASGGWLSPKQAQTQQDYSM